jgi:hypothetical protein
MGWLALMEYAYDGNVLLGSHVCYSGDDFVFSEDLQLVFSFQFIDVNMKQLVGKNLCVYDILCFNADLDKVEVM